MTTIMKDLFSTLSANEKEMQTFLKILELGAQPVSIIAKHLQNLTEIFFGFCHIPGRRRQVENHIEFKISSGISKLQYTFETSSSSSRTSNKFNTFLACSALSILTVFFGR